MMAAEITTQPSFSAGHPRILFEARYVPAANFFPNYDVSPDGQRFLMVKERRTGTGRYANQRGAELV